MQPLQRLALPAPAAALLAARHPGLVPVRCADLTFGLGLVLPLLARSLPFSRAPLGLRVPLTAGEISRGHHLLVLQGRQPAVYVGWAECSEAQGARYLGAEGLGALDLSLLQGEMMAILTVTALTPEAMAAGRLAMRALYPGRRYIGRRVNGRVPDGMKVPRSGVIRPLPAGREAAA